MSEEHRCEFSPSLNLLSWFHHVMKNKQNEVSVVKSVLCDIEGGSM